jgi:hypothetical protein
MSLVGIIILCTFLSTVVVMIHHEILTFITGGLLPRFSSPRRWHVGATVLVLMAAHVVEIAIFSIGMYMAGEHWDMGGLSGDPLTAFHTYLYFSFASYTSLGIGDIFPIGFLRLMAGVEALLGLLMIGWTASFLYLEMRTYWMVDNDP